MLENSTTAPRSCAPKAGQQPPELAPTTTAYSASDFITSSAVFVKARGFSYNDEELLPQEAPHWWATKVGANRQ